MEVSEDNGIVLLEHLVRHALTHCRQSKISESVVYSGQYTDAGGPIRQHLHQMKQEAEDSISYGDDFNVGRGNKNLPDLKEFVSKMYSLHKTNGLNWNTVLFPTVESFIVHSNFTQHGNTVTLKYEASNPSGLTLKDIVGSVYLVNPTIYDIKSNLDHFAGFFDFKIESGVMQAEVYYTFV